MHKELLGIDIGGSGIKGATVNLKKGTLTQKRYRIPTPEGGKPADVVKIVAKIIDHFKWKGPVGCGFPAAVRNGVALTAANIDDSWIGININKAITNRSGCPAFTLNDADAAATAMVSYGHARTVKGTVLVVTVGTGLGTAIFHNGLLLPNTELGHIEMRGDDAENFASDRVRKEQGLSWKKWGKRLGKYLQMMERLFWPELIILGGGVSKHFEAFGKHLNTETEVIPSLMQNEAGIIGAALAADHYFSCRTGSI